MATLKEMIALGYRPKQSSAQNIVDLITGTQENMQKQQDKKKQDVMDQVKLYGTFREAGYSKQESTDRVNRRYRSTSFFEKMFDGEGNAFQPPAEDQQDLGAMKTRAEIGEIKSRTRKNMSFAKSGVRPITQYDEATGEVMEVGTYDPKGRLVVSKDKKYKTDRTGLSPSDIKDIITSGNVDPNSPVYKAAIKKLSEMLADGNVNSSTTTAEPSKGALSVKVRMIRPDGVPVKVAAKDVPKKLQQGYNRRS